MVAQPCRTDGSISPRLFRRKTDRIKALIWEGDGFLLCYKRLEQKASKFQWPRSQEEVCKLTSQQFRWLMEGLTIKPKKCIQKIDHPRFV